jgi:hypothetical protein
MIDEILRNWALYLQTLEPVSPQPDSHCRSIEHRYIPEAGEVFTEENKKPFIDIQQGEKVEAIVCKLNSRFKEILKARYVTHPHLSKEKLARKLKMDKFQFEADLSIAKNYIKKEL